MKKLVFIIASACCFYLPLSIADEDNPFSAATAADGYIRIRYVGNAYQRLIVLDAKRQQLFNSKVVSGQSLSLPAAVGRKKVKKLYVQFYQREFELKVGCSKKLTNKAIGGDLIAAGSNFGKRTCVKTSKAIDTLVTTPPRAVNTDNEPSSNVL